MTSSATIRSVVVSYGRTKELNDLVEALSAIGRVTVVDNEGSLELTNTETLRPMSNLGYGSAVNFAVRESPSDATWLLVCNSDVEIRGDLAELPELLSEVKARIAGLAHMVGDRAFGISPSLRVAVATTVLGERRAASLFPSRRYPKGSFLLVLADEFLKVGGFDPRFFLYFEETDLAARLNGAGDLSCEFIQPQHCSIGHRGAGSTGRSLRVCRELGHSAGLYARKHRLFGWAIAFSIQLAVLASRQLVGGKLTQCSRTLAQLTAFIRTVVSGRRACSDQMFGSSWATRHALGSVSPLSPPT